MNAIEAYKARAEVEQEGAWVDLLGCKLLIKAANGRNKEFARLTKGLSAGQRIDDDKLFDKLVSVIGKTIVTDWEGFDDEYTPEAFEEVCNQLKDCGFVEDVMAASMDAKMWDEIAIAKTEKN